MILLSVFLRFATGGGGKTSAIHGHVERCPTFQAFVTARDGALCFRVFIFNLSTPIPQDSRRTTEHVQSGTCRESVGFRTVKDWPAVDVIEL